MFANWSKNWLNNSAMINKNSNSDHSKSLMTWTRPSRNSRKLFADFRPDFMLNFWSFHAPIHAKRQNSRYIHALKVRLYRKIEFISLNWITKTLIFQSLFSSKLVLSSLRILWFPFRHKRTSRREIYIFWSICSSNLYEIWPVEYQFPVSSPLIGQFHALFHANSRHFKKSRIHAIIMISRLILIFTHKWFHALFTPWISAGPNLNWDLINNIRAKIHKRMFIHTQFKSFSEKCYLLLCYLGDKRFRHKLE